MDTGHVLGLGLTIRREVGRSACWSLTLTLALTVTLTLTLALALALAPALTLTPTLNRARRRPGGRCGDGGV